MFCPRCRSDFPSDWKSCPKDSITLLKSSRIGKYVVDGMLGAGGMGAVYRATNPDTQGRVAIKVLAHEIAADDRMRERFRREAAALAQLRTSHVARVFDFGADEDGTLYLVMELLDGHRLRDEIRRPPDRMSLQRIRMVMDGALRGLAAAHNAGIIHRDLKPENIFIANTDDGEVPKVLDFGIARLMFRRDLTSTGTVVGTVQYMAPEQASAGEVGPWTDVYAMGAILYEMLAGVRAIDGQTESEVLGRVVAGDIAPLPNLRGDLDADVYALVERCLSRDPARRPADASVLLEDLGRCSLSPGLGPRAATAPRTVNLRRRRRMWIAATGGVVAAAGVVGFALLRDPRDEPARPSSAVVTPDAAAPKPPPVPDAYAGMTKIPAGLYKIGGMSPDAVAHALPAAEVRIPDLWIDDTEVTIGDLRGTLDPLPEQTANDTATLPARYVDWETANAACAARGKRLPTEAEWEIAARLTPQDIARARLRGPGSGSADDLVAVASDCFGTLCDMLGGVREWTADNWPGRPGYKVIRGASYRTPRSAELATIHARLPFDAKRGDNEIGFRCVRTR